MSKLSRTTLALAGVLLSASVASAQATRTWVSGVGDDANPCSRTAPCKTFAGAISKTADKGEINVLDPGGFGAVTITKSITISSDGAVAGILAAGTNGIIVGSTAIAGNSTIVVTLRNLDINGAGTGINGIRFLRGAALYIENCQIYGFTGIGIDARSDTNGAKLFVRDTIVKSNGGDGILIKPVGANVTRAFIDNVRSENNANGLRAEDNSDFAVSRSQFNRNFTGVSNTGNGIIAISPLGGGLQGLITDTVITSNTANGIRADNNTTFLRISNVTITRNNVGINTLAGAAVFSLGNNFNAGNSFDDGAPTSTILPQ